MKTKTPWTNILTFTENSNHLFVFSPIVLEEGDSKNPISTIEVLRVGTIQDRGLNITRGMLEDYVRNFDANVYGTELQVNFEHNRGGEAAGWIKKLFIDGESLMQVTEWTELGAEKIRKKLYKFVSSELAPEYPRFDTGEPISNVFIGAGLTNTPALKGQRPISLSEEDRNSFIHAQAMFKKLIADLKARQKLSEADITFAKSLLSDVAEAEKADAAAEVAALEAQQQEQAAAEKAAADEAAKKEEAKKEELKEKTGVVSLAEFNKLKEENTLLAQRVEFKELTEEVEKGLTLSEDRKVGFLDENVKDVVAFMHSLSADQRKAFKELMSKVKSVDLQEIGSTTKAEVEELSDDKMEKVTKMAAQLVKDGKAKNITEAQKMALEMCK